MQTQVATTGAPDDRSFGKAFAPLQEGVVCLIGLMRSFTLKTLSPTPASPLEAAAAHDLYEQQWHFGGPLSAPASASTTAVVIVPGAASVGASTACQAETTHGRKQEREQEVEREACSSAVEEDAHPTCTAVALDTATPSSTGSNSGTEGRDVPGPAASASVASSSGLAAQDDDEALGIFITREGKSGSISWAVNVQGGSTFTTPKRQRCATPPAARFATFIRNAKHAQQQQQVPALPAATPSAEPLQPALARSGTEVEEDLLQAQASGRVLMARVEALAALVESGRAELDSSQQRCTRLLAELATARTGLHEAQDAAWRHEQAERKLEQRVEEQGAAIGCLKGRLVVAEREVERARSQEAWALARAEVAEQEAGRERGRAAWLQQHEVALQQRLWEVEDEAEGMRLQGLKRGSGSGSGSSSSLGGTATDGTGGGSSSDGSSGGSSPAASRRATWSEAEQGDGPGMQLRLQLGGKAVC